MDFCGLIDVVWAVGLLFSPLVIADIAIKIEGHFHSKTNSKKNSK